MCLLIGFESASFEIAQLHLIYDFLIAVNNY